MKNILLIFVSIMMLVTFSACQKSGEINEPEASDTPQKQEEKMIQQEVSFYYPDEAVMYLCPETMPVSTRETEFLEAIVQTLINGPVDKNLNPSISGKVDVLSVSVKDGICTVDLSEEFVIHNTGGSTREYMAVYSIVNTLCSVDGIEKVKINIEGDENPDFGGHFDLSEPFDPDFSLVKK